MLRPYTTVVIGSALEAGFRHRGTVYQPSDRRDQGLQVAQVARDERDAGVVTGRCGKVGRKVSGPSTPPELAADVMRDGMVLLGGGSLLRGFAERLEEETHVACYLAQSPLTCVAEGAGRSLEELEALERGGKRAGSPAPSRGLIPPFKMHAVSQLPVLPAVVGSVRLIPGRTLP